MGIRKCAVYKYVGPYGGGLVFVPVKYDRPVRRYYKPDYRRLGEMNVNDTVLKFVKCGPTDSKWEEANYVSRE